MNLTVAGLKKKLKRSYNLVIIRQVWDNCRNYCQKLTGSANFSECGSTHERMTLVKSIGYINRVFDDYLYYGAISADQLKNRKILEIGTGDNLGVALKFIAAGAKQVVCLDKFQVKRNPQQELEIYRELLKQQNDEAKRNLAETIQLNHGIGFNPDKIVVLYGTGIEDAGGCLPANTFDLIISRAVLEYVANPDRAFRVMNRLLKPGGLMLHKIDLQDQMVFRDCGMHPLAFLTIPRYLYRWMTSVSCKPNRKPVRYYSRKMAELNYDAKILVTHLVGQEKDLQPHRAMSELEGICGQSTLSLIQKIRPRLTSEFRRLPNQELMISGVFLIARKKCAENAI